MPSGSFVCGTCGKTHDRLPTDWAYKLPDDVWALPAAERAEQAQYTTDLCQLGERFFIRCLLRVRMLGVDGYFGWGIWVEVQRPDFMRYVELYNDDATSEPQKAESWRIASPRTRMRQRRPCTYSSV